MGSPKTNFYNDAYRRGGFDDAAVEVQRLWLEGKREEAARRVPDEMVMQSSLLGPEEMVRERIRTYRDAGVSMLRLDPLGATPSERLDTLGRAVELVREECRCVGGALALEAAARSPSGNTCAEALWCVIAVPTADQATRRARSSTSTIKLRGG